MTDMISLYLRGKTFHESVEIDEPQCSQTRGRNAVKIIGLVLYNTYTETFPPNAEMKLSVINAKYRLIFQNKTLPSPCISREYYR